MNIQQNSHFNSITGHSNFCIPTSLPNKGMNPKLKGVEEIASKKFSFYNSLNAIRRDSLDLQYCIAETVFTLSKPKVKAENPTLLLGQVQSGKTRAYIGVIAGCFDSGFDVAIVLTSNSVMLTKQTTSRLQNELKPFIKANQIEVHDIFDLRDKKLNSKQINNQKIVLVVKKQHQNLDLLIECFRKHNPELRNKRVLIVDDEADIGSIGFKKSPSTELELIKSAEKISQFRSLLELSYSFLQVTGTPYAVALQPFEIYVQGSLYKPIRPTNIIQMPIHEEYIGGDFYFLESLNIKSPASNIYVKCEASELSELSGKKPKVKLLKDISRTKQLKTFKESLVNFFTGASILRIIESKNSSSYSADRDSKKYSFIYHIDTRKGSHNWQKQLLATYLCYLKKLIKVDPIKVKSIFSDSYNELMISVNKGLVNGYIKGPLPTFDSVWIHILQIFELEDYELKVINSDNKIKFQSLENGQLKLNVGLNIFIGAGSLDRGITIQNVIGFFYGRNPKVFNMDTAIQHARMYGSRPKQDLCVTRLYTTETIYTNLREIHDIDTNLRSNLRLKSSFNRNSLEELFVMEAPEGAIVPSSKQRLAISNIEVLKSYNRILPFGFKQCDRKTLIQLNIKIEALLKSCDGYTTCKGKTFQMPIKKLKDLLDLLQKTFKFDRGYQDTWNANSIFGLVEHFCIAHSIDSIPVYIQTNRKINRLKKSGGFSNAPDTSSTDGSVAKGAASKVPCLVLLKQQGSRQEGWIGEEFFWPILYNPIMKKNLLVSMR